MRSGFLSSLPRGHAVAAGSYFIYLPIGGRQVHIQGNCTPLFRAHAGHTEAGGVDVRVTHLQLVGEIFDYSEGQMTWQRIVTVLAVLLVFLFAWLGRYTIVGVDPPGGMAVNGIAYRLDRWTGEVAWISMRAGGIVTLGERSPDR